jgi:hypothetical protein
MWVPWLAIRTDLEHLINIVTDTSIQMIGKRAHPMHAISYYSLWLVIHFIPLCNFIDK